MMTMTSTDKLRYEELQHRLQGALGSQVCVVCIGTDADTKLLWPQERKAIESAISPRQKEYAAGRIAARRAMRCLGWPESAVPTRKDRSPVWPDGLVGSITHTKEICVVVMSSKKECSSLGIDIEPDLAVIASLWSSVCTRRELHRIWRAGSDARALIATKLFTAKEAFYKWQFQATGTPLEFQEIEINQEWGDCFEATPISDRARSLFHYIPHGQWVHSNGLTFASVGHKP